MAELLPCPFCGSTSLKIESKHHGTHYYSGTHSATVRCNKCHARGSTASCKVEKGKHHADEETKQKAIELWNTRPFVGENVCANTPIDGDSLAFDKLLDCIGDLYRLLAKISDDARKRDLSLMRVRGQAGPCDMYQGLPPICRIFHDIEDEHYDTIRIAMKASESESESVEPSSNP